jgi:HD-GYP domain-containing protein (c-di-GMP phosphodiesterase class II)
MKEQKQHPVRMLTLTGGLLIGIYLLIQYGDVTSTALPHLFYIPITYTAFFGTWYSSALTAVMSSLLLLISQNSSWLSYLWGFLPISLWTSLLTYCSRREAQRHRTQLAEVSQLQQASISALVDLTEKRNKDVMGEHLGRLGHYAHLLCSHLGLDNELQEHIVETIALHDIGKVAVPDSILKKPAGLDPKEWQIMKTHPIQGAEILDSIMTKASTASRNTYNYLKTARNIILYHHERYDGSGYPYGLAADAIPICARVAAICDVYDSLRSPRPYKKPFSHEKAVQIILQGKGTHFDPTLVEAFEELTHEFAAVWNQYGEN